MSTITTRVKDGLVFETQLGTHTLISDVPEAMGGQDRGPTPPQLFIASLSTCVAAMVLNYCQNARLNATDLSVDVSFDKADSPTRLTNLKIVVNMPNMDCDKRQEVLKRVAEHCPVHETITTLDGIDIEIVDQKHFLESS